MAIHYAAVQERQTWRKHSQHTSLDSATVGVDGAENLLRGVGRVGQTMREKYGQVLAVFAWEDGMSEAVALRLVRGTRADLERARVKVEILEKFRKGDGPTSAQIDEWFIQPPVTQA